MVQKETKGFISRLFGGSVPALASYLLDSEELTLDEIEELKALLKKKEHKLKE